ncbi:hypothetical protein LPH50_05240 [Xylella taiwanensis]|uniref:Uncharacterized protein n=1 Tax=Xylella taiwanensis TaxID=1444770 RepID=Z9JNW6_9GAMM|nr:hypothetical protein [Xylella taiwanensis]EWS79447.1 hypothetical protein AF72_00665 [Xylella taiwanensis]MCD8455381.1 hypothetical protein [Xylella taiwanensis]MCD8457785.1 hypothetical protein [Xylella taiwanensis]MCD8459921.1 hypothetical protein [Xylella taiwanensis]MCD8464018.1 hypothetical protein [Xylella taiwanensis]
MSSSGQCIVPIQHTDGVGEAGSKGRDWLDDNIEWLSADGGLSSAHAIASIVGVAPQA